MKAEISPKVAVVVIAVVVILAGLILWKMAVGRLDKMSPIPAGGMPSPGAKKMMPHAPPSAPNQ